MSILLTGSDSDDYFYLAVLFSSFSLLSFEAGTVLSTSCGKGFGGAPTFLMGFDRRFEGVAYC